MEGKILEGNKLIAEFMEGKVLPHGNCKPYPKGLPDWSKRIYDFDTLRIGGYEYHFSFDWLMPVVQKIESTSCHFKDNPLFTDPEDDIHNEVDVSFRFRIEGVECVIDYDILPQYYGTSTNFLELYDCRKLTNGSTKLDNTWLAVVAFITYYNQNLK